MRHPLSVYSLARTFTLAFALALAAAAAPVAVTAAMAEQIVAAPDANAAAQSGARLLVDVRSRAEWAESGVPAPAQAISMHEDGFIERLLAAVDGDPSRPIALICATGGRTAWLSARLEEAGFTDVSDVSEGMFGSAAGPGWIARGLPLRSCDDGACPPPR